MPWLTDFLNAHLIAITFIHGLAFFILGLAATLESGHTGAGGARRALSWLAAFGLLQTASQWATLAACWLRPTWSLPARLAGLLATWLSFASFLCLLQFGWFLPEAEPTHVSSVCRSGK